KQLMSYENTIYSIKNNVPITNCLGSISYLSHNEKLDAIFDSHGFSDYDKEIIIMCITAYVLYNLGPEQVRSVAIDTIYKNIKYIYKFYQSIVTYKSMLEYIYSVDENKRGNVGEIDLAKK